MPCNPRYAADFVKERRYSCSLTARAPQSSSSVSISTLDIALAGRNLHICRIDTTELGGLVVRQGVQADFAEVEAGSGVVDGEDVDGLAFVCDTVASTALQDALGFIDGCSKRGVSLPGGCSSRRCPGTRRCMGQEWRLVFASRAW